MSFGYSYRFVLDINARFKKQPDNLALELAALCIKYDIPMAATATKLSVSRQAMYKWFEGEYRPNPTTQEKITKLIAKIKKTYAKE